MSRNDSRQSSSDRAGAPSPELQQVLGDLQSPDEWTRANAVRTLCPCRRKDWGEPVYRYVVAMRDDPSPTVRGAVHHDLSENRCWNEKWEARLIQERRARRIKVTLALKGTSVADLCERLRKETGLPLIAQARVADEKVTLFCRQVSLRDVMRQLSRSLGYDWEWRKTEDAGHLELTRADQAPGPRKPASSARRVRDRVLRSRVSLSLSPRGDMRSRREPASSVVLPVRVTSADLLAALHRASGLPIIADFHTRLVIIDPAAFTDRPLGELVQQVAETMRMRWQFSDGSAAAANPVDGRAQRGCGCGASWLQFQSIWAYYEQLQEVPHRLLSRWAEWRRREGHLPLEALIEIAGLSSVQRTSEEMAMGAREIWGLAEWPLATVGLAEHLRFLAGFSPVQRAQAAGEMGLPFREMTSDQQQRFLSLAFGDGAPPSPEALTGVLLQVEYRPATALVEARLAFSYRTGRKHAQASVTFTAAGSED